MTAIASVAASVLAQTQAVQTASGSSAESRPPQATASSTLVSIAGIPPMPPLTYAVPATQPVWETNAVDGISQTMARNFSASTLSGRLQGLGQLMLQQLGGGQNDFSQSVYLPSTNAVPSTSLARAMQSALHTGANNQVSLGVALRDGARVQITLGDQNNGLAAAITVTGGKLSDADRSALSKMAGGLQQAIDGLTSSDQPTLDLSGLLRQFNSSVFASVDLNASVDPTGQGAQSLALHIDGTQRSLQTSGPLGSMQISVDTSNTAILGSASQQAQAIDNYLQQFAAEGTRGHGNARLIAMFSAAFQSLNSNDATASSGSSPQLGVIGDAAHSMMTGLADFSASVTQAAQSPNPMNPGEVDSFSYRVSQHTTEQASNRYNYTITQTQQSQLNASYHAPLRAGTLLALDGDKASQNYYYTQINDSAQSQTTIRYANGKLALATLNQSASASVHTKMYEMGQLQENTIDPSRSSWSTNLLDLLDSAQQNPGTSQAMLNNIRSLIELPASPGQLANKIG
ncbi:hypothetical protein [Bordetella sp. FB-8]|uniref:hypothetical protein n=1 Tax=Bordetella sp. FB-8 TaxID=1159870 RepID=UPI0003702969|nr:hypothetical protein [Bordetella sp. FB-8]